ncbi:Esterase FUS5 [Lachnellula suecica]|uniref:Esterase FUS5 n=1 Tax=Lachnellula suecica TaxID=602035 RepID=A0A8T9CE48_9HELO|nr:Esterase FUS5 [Lachnellula suecica]
MAPPEHKLPAILCLHGSGVNVEIFRLQTVRLQNALSNSFEFVFLNGPVEAPAGAGILPIFEGCEPFFRWKKTGDNIYEKDLDKETRDYLQKEMKKRDDWVGILGFSQGGRVAAGLLMEQEEEQKADMYGDEGGFKFGVFTMTPAPPMTALAHRESPELIKTPSLHVVGMQDHWYDSSIAMQSDYFDSKTSKLIEIDIGHRLPTADADTKMIAREILRMYKETTGIEGKLS